jgi:hypothetical protein
MRVIVKPDRPERVFAEPGEAQRAAFIQDILVMATTRGSHK